jgi:valyl-tRNA synthetase
LRKSYSIIEDEYVDIEFGTGCLKVTPAHDMNDKALGEKHNLEIIDIFNEDAPLIVLDCIFKVKIVLWFVKQLHKELETIGALAKNRNTLK